MNTTAENIATSPTSISPLIPASWPPANDFQDLVKVSREAVRLEPPLFFSSIFGTPASWLPPHRQFSEYNIINPWRLPTLARYLMDITLPASPMTEPDWARALFPRFINRRFWRPTSFFRQPDEYGGVSSFPGEHWFFINGVATNRDVAELNAAYIAHLFHRPVSVIQNATDSLPVDLFECAVGKGFKKDPDSEDRKTMTEPAWRATAAILEALNADDTHRVVIIAHSQGTIIMANVLRAVTKALEAEKTKEKGTWHEFTRKLMGGVQTDTHKILRDNLAHALFEFTKGEPKDALKRLDKLEIYTFANCADRMCYVYPDRCMPFMEHFANGNDIVARLGVLSPLRDDADHLVEIDGPVFERKCAWGHLLNAHYLTAINDYLYPQDDSDPRNETPYPPAADGPAEPRLYNYFHGKQPKDLSSRGNSVS